MKDRKEHANHRMFKTDVTRDSKALESDLLEESLNY